MRKGRERLKLEGVRSGRLTVVEFYDIEEYTNPKTHKRATYTRWLCRCDCGNEVVVRGSELMYQIRREKRGLSNRMSSCGCKQSEMMVAMGRKYGGHQAKDAVTGRYLPTTAQPVDVQVAC